MIEFQIALSQIAGVCLLCCLCIKKKKPGMFPPSAADSAFSKNLLSCPNFKANTRSLSWNQCNKNHEITEWALLCCTYMNVCVVVCIDMCIIDCVSKVFWCKFVLLFVDKKGVHAFIFVAITDVVLHILRR